MTARKHHNYRDVGLWISVNYDFSHRQTSPFQDRKEKRSHCRCFALSRFRTATVTLRTLSARDPETGSPPEERRRRRFEVSPRNVGDVNGAKETSKENDRSRFPFLFPGRRLPGETRRRPHFQIQETYFRIRTLGSRPVLVVRHVAATASGERTTEETFRTTKIWVAKQTNNFVLMVGS